MVELNYNVMPEMPDADKEFIEITTGGIGLPFPKNWNLPPDIVLPKGKVSIYGGLHKVGKTRSALSHVLYLADMGHRISIASFEMQPWEIWVLLWMQYQYLEYGNSFGMIQARVILSSKEPRNHERQQNYKAFRKKYGESIFCIYTPGWTARRAVYGHKLAENIFGKKATVWVTDNAQLVAKDPTIRDIREGQIANSLFFSDCTGLANVGHILISQLNKEGDTAESKQYERDAGMVINFIRDENKETGEKSPVMKIHVKHSRFTQSGLFERWVDVKSGAIVPAAGYTPPAAQGSFYDN